jgi:hypothetical protein
MYKNTEIIDYIESPKIKYIPKEIDILLKKRIRKFIISRRQRNGS